MSNKAVCYTTDKGYLFPSFVSATQARRALSPDVGRVVIVGLGLDSHTIKVFSQACEQEGITLVPVNTAAIDGASPYYARFFLADLLPAEIDTFLYVDSDTQITGSLDPLLTYEIPPDRFLAVTDPMVFALAGKDKLSVDVAAHFTSLGLSHGQTGQYFNSGVLMSNRIVWQDIGRSAWSLARAQPHDTRFPDQDMLNLAAQCRNLPLSVAWNFPIYMKNMRLEDSIQPRITHYMSNPKPWSGVFQPWTQAEYDVYGETLQAYPSLAPYRRSMPLTRRLRYHLQQGYKRLVEPMGKDGKERRDAVLRYEAGAILREPFVCQKEFRLDPRAS